MHGQFGRCETAVLVLRRHCIEGSAFFSHRQVVDAHGLIDFSRIDDSIFERQIVERYCLGFVGFVRGVFDHGGVPSGAVRKCERDTLRNFLIVFRKIVGIVHFDIAGPIGVVASQIDLNVGVEFLAASFLGGRKGDVAVDLYGTFLTVGVYGDQRIASCLDGGRSGKLQRRIEENFTVGVGGNSHPIGRDRGGVAVNLDGGRFLRTFRRFRFVEGH